MAVAPGSFGAPRRLCDRERKGCRVPYRRDLKAADVALTCGVASSSCVASLRVVPSGVVPRHWRGVVPGEWRRDGAAALKSVTELAAFSLAGRGGVRRSPASR